MIREQYVSSVSCRVGASVVCDKCGGEAKVISIRTNPNDTLTVVAKIECLGCEAVGSYQQAGSDPYVLGKTDGTVRHWQRADYASIGDKIHCERCNNPARVVDVDKHSASDSTFAAIECSWCFDKLRFRRGKDKATTPVVDGGVIRRKQSIEYGPPSLFGIGDSIKCSACGGHAKVVKPPERVGGELFDVDIERRGFFEVEIECRGCFEKMPPVKEPKAVARTVSLPGGSVTKILADAVASDADGSCEFVMYLSRKPDGTLSYHVGLKDGRSGYEIMGALEFMKRDLLRESE